MKYQYECHTCEKSMAEEEGIEVGISLNGAYKSYYFLCTTCVTELYNRLKVQLPKSINKINYGTLSNPD
jgi:hypothetical protein